MLPNNIKVRTASDRHPIVNDNERLLIDNMLSELPESWSDDVRQEMYNVMCKDYLPTNRFTRQHAIKCINIMRRLINVQNDANCELGVYVRELELKIREYEPRFMKEVLHDEKKAN